MTEKKYNFGEKTEEFVDGVKLPVWQSPKYIQSKQKAVELIEKGDYGLSEGDFWILINMNKSKKTMIYSGLIISHNGCLKINDKLDDKLKFKPDSVSFLKDENQEKVMQYINGNQGIYEFGELSSLNCKNKYPYAMVLKRLMDRVILKNSKVGFFGIYSEAESDEFKKEPDLKKDDILEEERQSLYDECRDLKESIIGELEMAINLDNLREIWEENVKELKTLKSRMPKMHEAVEKRKEELKTKLQ